LQLAHELDAVDAGQLDVDERDARARSRQIAPGRFPAHRGAHDLDVGERREELQDRLQERRLVLDDEQGDPLGHARRRLAEMATFSGGGLTWVTATCRKAVS